MQRFASLFALLTALAAVSVLAQDRWDHTNYKPPTFANADNHPRVPFLPAARDWERMDIYVPKTPAEGTMPCVIIWYGGGWGGKVTTGIPEAMKALLARGYVVAFPDYLLGAQQPVPQAVWDGAAAVRFLRANAATYRIDPTRIGGWGYSAGGWLVQHLAPADAATLVGIRMEDALGRKLPGSKYLPTIEPHPANAEQSARLQAFATDWGAGMIGKDVPASVLTPDDPPMFTCHNNPAGAASAGVVAYRNAGAVAEFVTLDAPKGTHVPDGKTPGKLTDGTATTWYDSVCGFFDAYLKAPKCAAAPEAFPAGGPLAGPTDVRLASVYAAGAIHYTLDGTAPTAASPRYDKPVTVKPSETLKTITIAPGLETSAVTSVTFTAGAAAPVITNTAYTFTVKKGEPFSVTFQAKSDKPVSWYLAGKVSHVPAAVDPNAPAGAPKKPSVPWLTLDPTTGVLSGTATTVGVNVVIVAANVPDGKTTLADARTVMVTVTE